MITLPTTTRRPHGEAPCEVLSVLTGGDDQWTDYRGRRFGDWLDARGIRHGWCHVGDSSWLSTEISNRGVRVVLSEAQALPTATVADLAAGLPNVRFVHLLHGAPSWCASSAPALTYDSIRQARDFPNVYLGTVYEPTAMVWLEGAKITHLPNPVEIPKGLSASATPNDLLCVSLVARPSPVKNWGGMLAALGLLSRRRKVRVLLVGRDHTPNHHAHLDYARDLGLDADTIPFGDWADNISRIADTVHVGLACGYSDSLNLVAAEHCLLGIPVVGSPALDWLPCSWIVSPQDPRAMAEMAETLASDPKAGPLARQVALDLSRRNEKVLLKNIRGLLA